MTRPLHGQFGGSRDSLQETRLNVGHVREGKMQDVLLAATHEAGAMIEENLNGISFANSRMALSNLVLTLQQKRGHLESMKAEVSAVDEQRRQDVWQLLQHEVSPLGRPAMVK